MDQYVTWCNMWIYECKRVLKPGGTLFIYGFSEVLMFLGIEVEKLGMNTRWLVWHYTNKTIPSLNFWQRSHESILCCWEGERPNFNRDDVREPYSKQYLKCKGKKRAATKGRFGQKETTYNVNESGALPRDVIKISTLDGGAGRCERVDHPTQKPLALCEILLKSALLKDGDTYLDQTVVIPFCGSGSEAVACKKLGVGFIAFEINHDYIEIAKERLNADDD